MSIDATAPLATTLSLDEGRYRCTAVSTALGEFSVGTWGDSSMPVLALHGISSNHLLWSWAAAAAPDLHIVAPDLRGRGGSTRQPPFGLARHRDDMLAVMDALELERVVLAGMSMGGFVATAMAAMAPDRFASVLLVDGGLPFVIDDDTAARSEVNNRGAATTTFESVAAYADTWLAVLGSDLDRQDPLLQAFMGWNLDETSDGLQVRLPGDALATDAADVFAGAPTAEWLAAVTAPTHLLYVPNGLAPIDVDGWMERVPNLTAQPVDGVDHATIVMGPRGGMLVADTLRSLTGSVTEPAS